jgi:hypothetical protein
MYLKISRQRSIKLAANQIRDIYNLSDALAIRLAVIHFFKPKAVKEQTRPRAMVLTHNNACLHCLDIKARPTTNDMLPKTSIPLLVITVV